MDDKQAYAVLAQHPDYRVQRRLLPPLHYRPATPGVELATAVVLDTETTGRTPGVDRIVELGLVKFRYEPATGQVVDVVDTFSAFEDPGQPIPPEATRVNGITDAMVAGHRIDDQALATFMADVDLVVAHQAGFDRKFAEARFPLFQGHRWACSLTQVPWEDIGIGSSKLDYIAHRFGFFYEAHRALVDCQALLHVLAQPWPGPDAATVLDRLLQAAQQEIVRVWAVGAPFETKALLKSRGYYWSDGSNDQTKAWYRDRSRAELEDELAWLRTAVHAGRSYSALLETFTAATRFSARRGALLSHYG